MMPKADLDIGMEVYSTSFAGCGGKIKAEPGGFKVTEIISKQAASRIGDKKGYAVYLLKKQGIDTRHALHKIFQRSGLRLKSLGLKDAHATTEQYVCATSRGRSPEGFESGRLALSRIGYTERPLTKKDMIGNRFIVTVSEHDGRLGDFNDRDAILNFYGYQRFGSRRAVTHSIGKAIVHGNFARAIEHILTLTSQYDSKPNTDLRVSLQDPANYSRVLRDMPTYMDVERLVLREMIAHGSSLAALRAVPIQLRRLYVQAYQSYLFNRTLSAAFMYGEDLFSAQESDVCYDDNGSLGRFIKGADQHLAVPIVGYSYFKKTRFDYHISRILETEEISPKDFFIKELQEVSAEGSFRDSALKCKDFAVSGSTVFFTLGRGSYATVLLREVIKPEDPASAGF